MDIVRNILKISSLGTIVFFLLNITSIFLLFSNSGSDILITIFIIYFVSVILAFSPIGEWVLCFLAGAKKMTRADMQMRIQPILDIVYREAKFKTPRMTDTIEVRIIYSSDVKAYAIGRKTICVTEGLLRQPDDIIIGVLSHEVAHLAHRHTEIQLLIGGGNIFITLFIILLKAVAVIITGVSIFSGIRNRSLLKVAIGMFVAGVIWVWTKFCMLFLSWSMRENEYIADAYAAQIGYGFELAKALDVTRGSSPQESFLKALYSTHPNIHDRIGRLQEMGVPYYSY